VTSRGELDRPFVWHGADWGQSSAEVAGTLPITFNDPNPREAVVDRNKNRKLPARSTEVESREFDGEFIVLDTTTNQAHSLTGASAAVWRATEDGSWPDLTDAQIDEAVAELTDNGLLVIDGHTRRTVIRVGAVGGAALAMSAGGLMTVAMPAAAATSSRTVTVSGTTISLAAGATLNYTLFGGGGGGGIAAGSAGGKGAEYSGTILNNNGTAVTLTVDIATGGRAGVNGTAVAGGTGFEAGGVGGTSGGGGGGGASAILTGATALVIAGGGGGGSAQTEVGGSGLTTTGTGTGAVGGAAASVEGAGGGGGSTGGVGGHGMTTPAAGAGGNNIANAAGLVTTFSATPLTGVTAAGAAGAAGSAGGAGELFYSILP
jgi:hypothetical protein